MHSDNKEKDGKKDKSELGNINEHTMNKREENHIDNINDWIDEQEGQACQKFVFIPFHGKNNGSECDKYLKKIIN